MIGYSHFLEERCFSILELVIKSKYTTLFPKRKNQAIPYIDLD